MLCCFDLCQTIRLAGSPRQISDMGTSYLHMYEVAAPFTREGGRGTRFTFSKSPAAQGNRAAIFCESMSFAAQSESFKGSPRRPSVPDFRFLEVVWCSGSILAHRVYIFAGKRGLKILQLRKVLMN